MKTFIPVFNILFTILFLPFFLSAQTGHPSSNINADAYVVVEGHKMHYQTGGSGRVTVVFESGHGDDMYAWKSVYTQVAKFAKVLRYDREGYGLSDTVTQPGSFKEIAGRLHQLLDKAKIRPPYILAGHSLGGALIRAYAYLYPNEVAGFVLIDPFNEYFGTGLRTEEKTKAAIAMDSIMANSSGTYAAEWQIMKSEFLKGFPEINSYGPLPDVPMVLFAAGKDRPDGWEASIRQLFENKIKAHSENRFIEIPQSPHYVQDFEPSLVIENIRRVVFPDAENVLRKIIKGKGVDSCIAKFKKIRLTYPKEYILERFLNTLGYSELHKGHIQAAIKLFKLNVEMYPNSSNVYDSIGEAYMIAGNKSAAIANYKKSFSLNPANHNAQNMLKKIKK